MKRSTLYFIIFIAGLIILATRKFLRDVTGLGFEWIWIGVFGAAVLGLIIFGLRYHKDVDSDFGTDSDESITNEKDRVDPKTPNKQKTEQAGDGDAEEAV